MNGILLVIITILVFGVIIIIHELGHFCAARMNRVRVNEFSIGMGPAIWSSKKKPVHPDGEQADEPEGDGRTKYSIRAFPIGGYVAMEGEDQESRSGDAFCNKPVWRRITIIVAGAAMNLILGFLILCIVFATMEIIPSRSIAVFNEDAISNGFGLQIGDEILRVNGRYCLVYDDIINEILSDDDGIIDFVVRRDGETVHINRVEFRTVIDEENDSRQLDIDFKIQAFPNSFTQTMSYSASRSVSLGRMIWLSLGDIVKGNVGFDQLSGPVGVGEALGEAASSGLPNLFVLVAFLSINVGIFNLLPLPALDGGRLIFLIIEGIFRKPVPAKYEGVIHAVGLIALFGLMIAVTFKDIINLF